MLAYNRELGRMAHVAGRAAGCGTLRPLPGASGAGEVVSVICA